MTGTSRRSRTSSLRLRIVGAAGFGAAWGSALGWLGAAWLSTGPIFLPSAGAVFTAIVISAASAVSHHRFPRLGPANVVTTWRAVLVALMAGLIWDRATAPIAWAVVGTTSVIAILDGVDGWLARRTGLVSAFGARFDMEVDALLILVLSILVWRHDKAGGWVLACGLMRYAFVATGRVLPWMAGPLRSTFRGKAVAIGQLVGLGAALVPPVTPPGSAIVAAVTLVALVWSFALDVAWLRRQPARLPTNT